MFAKKLLDWYHENGRHLPWRETTDPYRIWLSEVILQQTRIEQGRAYYERMLAAYPTVRHLADATEQQVLKSWQGLGYYSRARNLHATAKQIAYQLEGRFPDTLEGLLQLKGVGRYTAAAIASFAFGLPVPVIDGNVYRFIARLYGIYTPIATQAAYTEFERLLLQLIDTRQPAQFNQALMDFGSTYCRPTGCDCAQCPFATECVAYREGKVELLPVRRAPRKPAERWFYYFDIRWEGQSGTQLVLQQRTADDIWKGLYELPLTETAEPITEESLLDFARQRLTEWMGREPAELEVGPHINHQLTHRTIRAQFLRAKYMEEPPQTPPKAQVVEWGNVKTIPFSRLIDKYLRGM